MQEAVIHARAAGMYGEPSDLLRIESEMADQLRPALADVREALKLNSTTSTPAVRSIETELESAMPFAKRNCASAIWSARIGSRAWR